MSRTNKSRCKRMMVLPSLARRLVGCHGVVAVLIWSLIHNLGADAIPGDVEVILVKIGGSSITHKGQRESLNQDSLDWFARSIASSLSSSFLAVVSDTNNTGQCRDDDHKNLAFVIVHGAASFGHFSAKDYQ